MTIIFRACFILTALFALSLAGLAQGLTPEKVENSIKAKEPAWQLAARESQPKSTIYRWKSGAEKVIVEIFVAASPEAATDMFRDFTRKMPVPPKEKLKGLGDEALLWQGRNTNDCMIVFRQSNAFFQINGSSLIHAKRFAGHLSSLAALK